MRGFVLVMLVLTFGSVVSAAPGPTEMPYSGTARSCVVANVVYPFSCEVSHQGSVTVSGSSCMLEGCYVAAYGAATASMEGPRTEMRLVSQLGTWGGWRSELCAADIVPSLPTTPASLECAGGASLFVRSNAGECSDSAWIDSIVTSHLPSSGELYVARGAVGVYFKLCRDQTGDPRIVPSGP